MSGIRANLPYRPMSTPIFTILYNFIENNSVITGHVDWTFKLYNAIRR